MNKQERSKHKTKDGKLAPMWTPNNSATACECCEGDFTFMRRRHHCRNCGSIVCAPCSTFRFSVPHVDDSREQRVCDSCFQNLVEASPEYVYSHDIEVNGLVDLLTLQFMSHVCCGVCMPCITLLSPPTDVSPTNLSIYQHIHIYINTFTNT